MSIVQMDVFANRVSKGWCPSGVFAGVSLTWHITVQIIIMPRLQQTVCMCATLATLP